MKNKTIFLDRDGIINKVIIRDGKPCSPRKIEEFQLLPNIEECLKIFKEMGFDCEMVFVIQRTDCKSFTPARHIDSKYADKLASAARKGVQITALCCSLDPTEVKLLQKTLPIHL